MTKGYDKKQNKQYKPSREVWADSSTGKNYEPRIGGGVGSDYSYSVYNPHNARFYFLFDSSSLNQGRWGSVASSVNRRESCLRDWLGCRWVVKKRMLEVTNKVSKDRRFYIRGSLDERRSQVVDAVAVLELEVVDRLREFVRVFGGSTDFVVVKRWIPDNKILHDKLVDAIPQSVTFRNDVVKKVYNTVPSNVEFSSPEFVSNAFRNLGLFDFAPLIAEELGGVRADIAALSGEALKPLTEQIRLHLAVQEKTLSVLSLMEEKLRRGKVSASRKVLEDWGW